MDKKGQNAAKREEFARLVVQGMTKADAYRKAFNASGKSDAAVSKAVQRLSKDGVVVAKMAELEARADEVAIMGRQRRLVVLSEAAERAARDGDSGALVKLVAELNRMTGGYEPEKVEVSGLEMSIGRLLDELGEFTT